MNFNVSYIHVTAPILGPFYDVLGCHFARMGSDFIHITGHLSVDINSWYRKFLCEYIRHWSLKSQW